MNGSPNYSPPPSAEIKNRQNEFEALRLLIAQRRFYSRAKRWLALRWIGMLVIGIGAPPVSIIWPSLAVVSGAVAGVWLFLGRTLLAFAQESLTAKGAAVQEQFDFYVFSMPYRNDRPAMPSPEDIVAIVGPDDQVHSIANRESLLDWYSIDTHLDGVLTVATCQRANLAYTARLLRVSVIWWVVMTAIWIVFLGALSLYLRVSLSWCILGFALPVLPVVLDVVERGVGMWRSATERRDLAQTIEKRMNSPDNPLTGHDLLVWQERLFGLRRSPEAVPDFLYRRCRKTNEMAMQSAARLLGRRSSGNK